MNMLKTVLLMTVLTAALVLVGGWVGGEGGALVALIVAGAMNFGSYFFSDKIVLRMYRAREVTRAEAPVLYEVVESLSRRAGLPVPRVAIIPGQQPNAFATGRNPEHAVVAATEGILQILDRDEIEGVMAHELAHVRHRDMLISSVAATLAGAIMVLARFGLFFGGGDRDRGGGALALLVVVLAPIAAMIIQAAISRSREFAADAGGAEISGKPRALASALRKLEATAKRVPLQGNPATAHMFIVHPFRGGGIGKMFSTHPPTEERVERLLQMRGLG
ncbi:MAG TPA: zinc metalloprotease HtpX [Gemmatimonadota bacterium]|jgi:heat shock protein HtpX|nr:zinc metalloprotease HtpX [Gemmatimonadota bacterium]